MLTADDNATNGLMQRITVLARFTSCTKVGRLQSSVRRFQTQVHTHDAFVKVNASSLTFSISCTSSLTMRAMRVSSVIARVKDKRKWGDAIEYICIFEMRFGNVTVCGCPSRTCVDLFVDHLF